MNYPRGNTGRVLNIFKKMKISVQWKHLNYSEQLGYLQ